VRLEQRLCSASHDTKVRLLRAFIFCGPRPLPAPIYDGRAADEKFSAKPAGAGWVNGSPAIPMKVGLGSAGGDTVRAPV